VSGPWPVSSPEQGRSDYEGQAWTSKRLQGRSREDGRDESDCIAFLVPKPGVGRASRNGGERAWLVVVQCVCTRLVDESN